MRRPPAGVIAVATRDIQGVPDNRMLAQWVTGEAKPWWTERALKSGKGLLPWRTTGCFIRKTRGGWWLKVFTDAERAAIFKAGPRRTSSSAD